MMQSLEKTLGQNRSAYQGKFPRMHEFEKSGVYNKAGW
jgi:hypothetical protein